MTHTLLAQSAPATQAFPVAHFAHDGPPQSMSVSAPFFTASEHVGAWQIPLVQTLLRQSLPTVHCFPVLHFAHDGPPQSMSVSAPFFTDSLLAYADAALKLDEHADVTAARCWVGVL